MVKNNQNIFDFTLENFGTLENLFSDVLIPNSLPVDSEIKPNQEVNIDTFEKGNQTIKKEIQTSGLVMTNGDIEAPEDKGCFEYIDGGIFELISGGCLELIN